MAQSSYPAGGDGRADGEAVGCRKIGPRQGLAILQRLAPAGRAHLSRAYHTIP